MDKEETSEIVVDFGKICRLCLTDEGVFINLYSTNSFLVAESKSIPEKIMDLMSIVVNKNDGFPPWICHNCLSQVDKSCEFINMCRTSQATLNDSYLNALSEAGLDVLTYSESENPSHEVPLKSEFYIKEVESEAVNEEPTYESETNTYCTDCSKVFPNEEEFFIHRVGVHHDDLVIESTKAEEEEDNESNIWTCDPCGAKFYKKNAIISHIRSKHLKERRDSKDLFKKPISCKYCGLSFSRKNLGRHLEVIHKIVKNMETDLKNVDCRICLRPFMRYSALRNHIEKFHGDNLELVAKAENCEIVWNCHECDSVFLDEAQLMQHYGKKHSKYPLEISPMRGLKSRNLICHCGVICSNTLDIALHEIFYHLEDDSKTKLECPGCEDIFPSVNKLKAHLILYHTFTSMCYENECVFCNLQFNSNELLKDHISLAHAIESGPVKDESFVDIKMDEEEESKINICHTCKDIFESAEELIRHKKECHGSLNCELCDKSFKTEALLKKHLSESHNAIKPIKCPLCPKVFPRKMNLHNHYRRRHLKQTKKFVCSYCGQSLKGKVALRSHEDRLHRNIRRYQCSECPEAFTTRSILLKHAQRHLSERPMLQCKYCDRKFSTISGIERHVKTHEGVKEFVCELPVCRKSFYTKSELKRHMKYHTRDFKHVCPVCNHKFMSPGELRKHSTKHTGERPFKCHLCTCAYARRDDKVKHLKRVHNLKVKRVYGKPLKKYSEEDNELVDTIVIDDGSEQDGTNKNEIIGL